MPRKKILHALAWPLRQPSLAFGSIRTTDDCIQLHWSALALHRPSFHAIAQHAIAFSQDMADAIWLLARSIIMGEIP